MMKQGNRSYNRNLNNKIALITGSATGIGRAIALQFAQMKATVIVHYNHSAKEAAATLKKVRELNARGVKVKADIAKGIEVKALFNFIREKFGHLDILVNNAGWTEFVDLKDIVSLNEEMYNRIMDVNVKGVLLCTKEAVGLMRKAREPAIVNIASTSGLDGTGSNIIYCASKAAVIAMTKSFAKALAPHIRVNAVAPGYTKTRFISVLPKRILINESKKTPIQRIARAEDIANVVVSLCEEMKFINGQTIIVDGGRCLVA